MIITMIYGGLGNQMFQYAIAKSIANKNGVNFQLDISRMNSKYFRDFNLEKFKIDLNIAKEEDVRSYKSLYLLESLSRRLKVNFFIDKYLEKKEFVFDKNVMKLSSCYIQGYWQSFRYFTDIRDVLLNDFRLKGKMNYSNLFILDKIKSQNSISVHIRRGDYVTNKKNSSIYHHLNINYYRSAIDYMASMVEEPFFFIFSDDPKWAHENLKLKNTMVVDVNKFDNPEFDLVLMSECEHNIIANSTFSWWGAWLNQNKSKIVVCPKKWMVKSIDLSDLYPEEWVQL